MTRILVADDEQKYRDQFVEWVREMDPHAEITAANSHAMVMRLAQETRPDLALLDVMMPGDKDHIDSSEKLRSLGVRVIFLTGIGEAPAPGKPRLDTTSLLKLGMEVLDKPSSKDELHAAVRRVLACPAPPASPR